MVPLPQVSLRHLPCLSLPYGHGPCSEPPGMKAILRCRLTATALWSRLTTHYLHVLIHPRHLCPLTAMVTVTPCTQGRCRLGMAPSFTCLNLIIQPLSRQAKPVPPQWCFAAPLAKHHLPLRAHPRAGPPDPPVADLQQTVGPPDPIVAGQYQAQGSPDPVVADPQPLQEARDPTAAVPYPPRGAPNPIVAG